MRKPLWPFKTQVRVHYELAETHFALARKCTNSVSFQDAIDVEDLQIPPRTRALTNAEQEDFEASELTLDHPPSSTTARLASNEDSIKEAVINTDSSTSQQNATKDMKSVGPMDFEMLCIIGLGAFGKVHYNFTTELRLICIWRLSKYDINRRERF